MSSETLLAYARSVHDRLVAGHDIPADTRAHGYAWGWAYTAEACLIAYARTSDLRFMEWFVGSYEAILRNRDCELGLKDDYRGRITSSWGAGRYMPGKWMTQVVLGGRITYPSLMFARIVLSAQDLHPQFLEPAKRYVEIARAVVREYDEDFVLFPEIGRYYYCMPLKGEVDAINHVHSLVNCQILLAELTADPLCREKAVACCEVFRDSIRKARSGAYYWTLRPYWVRRKNNTAGEPIWKAQVSAATAILAYRAGLVFDLHDMACFTKTFTNIVHAGGTAFRDRIDLDQGRTDHASIDFHRLYNVVGFIGWSEFEPKIADTIFRIVDARRELFPQGFFTHPSTTRGYAYQLAPQASAMGTRSS